LLSGRQKGWITIESGDPARPDAICSDCDSAWRAAGNKFTDTINDMIRIRVVCAACYDELQARDGVAR
jgi:hypothetical protein